jgi:hypothetical protein
MALTTSVCMLHVYHDLAQDVDPEPNPFYRLMGSVLFAFTIDMFLPIGFSLFVTLVLWLFCACALGCSITTSIRAEYRPVNQHVVFSYGKVHPPPEATIKPSVSAVRAMA